MPGQARPGQVGAQATKHGKSGVFCTGSGALGAQLGAATDPLMASKAELARLAAQLAQQSTLLASFCFRISCGWSPLRWLSWRCKKCSTDAAMFPYARPGRQ